MAAVLIVVSLSSVVARYVFSSSLIWADEFLRYFFVWAIMLASPALLMKNKHIIVDFTHMVFPEKVRKVLSVLTLLILVGFILTMFVNSLFFVNINMQQQSAAMQLPMGLVYLCMPLGFLLMFLSCLRLFGRDCLGCFRKKDKV